MPWFSASHWLGLATIALVCALTFAVGRRYSKQGPWLNRLLVFNLVVYIVIAYAVRWHDLSWATCLPLHLCDLILVGGIYLLLGRGQSARRQVAYDCLTLWSWSGSIWALITPDLPVDFPHYRYFEFFWGHGLIFVVMAHLHGWHRLSLTASSWKRAAWALQVWLFVVGALDYAFGWNYGYLLYKPPGGSPLDYFGPWPIYVLIANAVSVLIFWSICAVFCRQKKP